MKPLPKVNPQELVTEAADAKRWLCASCDKMIEDGQPGPHCRYCASYWEDVSRWDW